MKEKLAEALSRAMNAPEWDQSIRVAEFIDLLIDTFAQTAKLRAEAEAEAVEAADLRETKEGLLAMMDEEGRKYHQARGKEDKMPIEWTEDAKEWLVADEAILALAKECLAAWGG